MPNKLPAHVAHSNCDIDLKYNQTASYLIIDIKLIYTSILFKQVDRNLETKLNILDHQILFLLTNRVKFCIVWITYTTYDNCFNKLAIIQGKAGTSKSIINEMAFK